MQALALADEELDAEVFLELADAGGDVGLHAVQLLGGTRDAAGADDGAEDVQVDEIHRSQSKIIMIIIIHFSSYRRGCKAFSCSRNGRPRRHQRRRQTCRTGARWI